ncbi:MAG: alpha/beta hydrolase [Roseicyclus sp.]|nr:alpha/beta hydrolase [Roseicyclus sp.]
MAHGHGPDHDRTRDFHDQATAEAARHLPDAPCHLIGHSFGATLALRIALDQPARIASLTLFEPVLFCASNGPGRAAHDGHSAGLPRALAGGDTAAAARIFLDLWGTQSFDDLPERHRTYITDRIWIPEVTEPALVYDRAHILARLPRLMTPTLLLQGANSPPVVSEINTRLADDLPNAQCHTIPNAGHMAPITHTRQSGAAITAFLDRL